MHMKHLPVLQFSHLVRLVLALQEDLVLRLDPVHRPHLALPKNVMAIQVSYFKSCYW